VVQSDAWWLRADDLLATLSARRKDAVLNNRVDGQPTLLATSTSSSAQHKPVMNALSRREEETLLKATKARALQECDDVVKGGF